MNRNLKKSLLVFTLFIGTALGLFLWLSSPSLPSKPVLTLLTYSSFGGVYGPGRKLKEEFEKTCQCQVQWLLAEDSTGLIQRLQLKIPVDVVIGLDQISLFLAQKFQWKKHNILEERLISEVRSFHSPFFIPIDWAPIGWIYKGSRFKEARSFSDLLALSERISFPEPETSTLGLQLYYWLYSESERNLIKLKEIIKKLKKTSYGPIPSWSLAYGLFRKGRVEMSLSYLTSLSYHRREEGDFSYQFAYFDGGHPWQVEFAGVPDNCEKCALALSFVEFLLEPSSQKIITESHFMFPVIPEVKTGVFSNLKLPKSISYELLPDFLQKKEELLKIWRQYRN